jgi:hypothetical protein
MSRSFGMALTGRPAFRAIAARFRFLCFICRLVGIDVSVRILRAHLSAKYLKKWYLRPARAAAGQCSPPPVACFRCPFCRRMHSRHYSNGLATTIDARYSAEIDGALRVADDTFATRAAPVQPMRELHKHRTKFNQRARRLSRG